MLTGREVSKDEKITIMLLPVLCSDVSFISRAGCYRAGLRRIDLNILVGYFNLLNYNFK